MRDDLLSIIITIMILLTDNRRGRSHLAYFSLPPHPLHLLLILAFLCLSSLISSLLSSSGAGSPIVSGPKHGTPNILFSFFIVTIKYQVLPISPWRSKSWVFSVVTQVKGVEIWLSSLGVCSLGWPRIICSGNRTMSPTSFALTPSASMFC